MTLDIRSAQTRVYIHCNDTSDAFPSHFVSAFKRVARTAIKTRARLSFVSGRKPEVSARSTKAHDIVSYCYYHSLSENNKPFGVFRSHRSVTCIVVIVRARSIRHKIINITVHVILACEIGRTRK